jgi:hypothetical protein
MPASMTGIKTAQARTGRAGRGIERRILANPGACLR